MVDLDDIGDGPFEKGAVVADHHERRNQAEHPFFKPSKAVDVEVIRRFVEQHDVEAREQQ